MLVDHQTEDILTETGENVVIQSGGCTVTLLPDLGGKIASIRIGPHELLQAPLHPYAPRNPTMPFDQADASGWDECLPSVAQCSIETNAGPASIPDHGDLWRVPWQLLGQSPDSVTLRARCFSLPLQLTRSLILSPLSGQTTGWNLQLLYSLTNLGGYNVPFSWCAHPLFATLPGDRILLPPEVNSLRLEGSGDDRLGNNGDWILWPVAPEKLPGSPHVTKRDLRLAQPSDSRIGDKLFTGPLQQGWATLARPSIGLQLTVRFDPRLTPFLGLWICYGGWPEAPGNKQVCVALEPCTAPVDSLAETGAWSKSLEPGETFSWPMELEISSLSETRSH
jgi:galactose mutarotase-like enzyme